MRIFKISIGVVTTFPLLQSAAHQIKVESGTSQSKSRTSAISSNSGDLHADLQDLHRGGDDDLARARETTRRPLQQDVAPRIHFRVVHLFFFVWVEDLLEKESQLKLSGDEVSCTNAF